MHMFISNEKEAHLLKFIFEKSLDDSKNPW